LVSLVFNHDQLLMFSGLIPRCSEKWEQAHDWEQGYPHSYNVIRIHSYLLLVGFSSLFQAHLYIRKHPILILSHSTTVLP